MSTPTTPSRLPGYEILEELGAGGMGVVFKARQVALKRIVAIKMIRSGIKPGRHELARFRFEAEAVARLQHPNIVQVFAVGEVDGEPHIVMEYLDGGSLAKKINGQPQPWRDAAGLTELLAKAVKYAHSRGIIHRDLKPANVLLTADGVPKIGDFGLAKSMEGDGVSDGQGILGSPSYMAPEQAWGGSRIKDLGPAVDVYALGAVLYELLTGRPPFKGGSSRETLEQVWRDRPVPPRLIVPAIPRDLEIICLKCLEKEPAKRYADAHELAEDLRRFRKGIPIKARAVGRSERVWSWCRRNPLPASLVMALVIAIVAGFVGVTAKYIEAESARRDADTEAKNAKASERLARASEKRARDAEAEAKDLAEKAREAENKAREAERVAIEKSQLADMTASSIENDLRSNDLSAALAKLEVLQDRGFEYHWLLRRARAEKANWPYAFREPWDLALNPAGNLAAVASLQSREIDIIDLETGEKKRSLPGHEGQAVCVAWSGDGKLIATGGADGFARLWNAETGELLASLKSDHGPVDDVAISGNGNRLACAHGDTTAAVWSIENPKDPKRLSLFTGHARRYPHREDWMKVSLWTHTRIAISGDGTFVATAADHHGSTKGERTIRGILGGATCDVLFWNADDGSEKHAILGVPVPYIHDLALSADGTVLAAAGDDGTIYAWTAPDGRPLTKRTGHTGPVRRIAFVGQDHKLVSASWDRSFRLWDLRSDRASELLHRPAHNNRVSAVAVTADGQRVVTGAQHEIKIWQTQKDPGYVRLPRIDTVNVALAHPVDPKLLVTGSKDGVVRVWDITTRKPVFSIQLEGLVSVMRFSPDHRRLAVASGRKIFVIDLAERKVVATYNGQENLVTLTRGVDLRGFRDIAFSADGETIVSLTSPITMGGEAHAWHARSGQTIWACSLQTPPERDVFSGDVRRQSFIPSRVSFSVDGASVAIKGTVMLSLSGSELVLDAKTGEALRRTSVNLNEVTSPKNELTASASWSDHGWDVVLRGKPGTKPIQLKSTPRRVGPMAFNPAGTRLAIGSNDEHGSERGEVKLFETRSGHAVLKLDGFDSEVRSVTFSADGNTLIVLTDDGAIRTYDGTPAKPATQP